MRAGLHCQLVLADHKPKYTKKSNFFVEIPACPLCGGTGGGHLRVCWILWLQSANPLSFRHHYLAVMR
ncbi:hypothetical protein DC362_07970 [Acinetobacter nosocomialis]|nr:hypothetical protein DC362_07970 [Acinetobacter nosocomialis]